MSGQPPPIFGDHQNSNSAYQWPGQYSSMLPPSFPTPLDYSAINAQMNNNAPFDYNLASVDANSRIPGPSLDPSAATFFPTSFPPLFNPFDASQFPSPMDAMHLPQTGCPPGGMPAVSSNAPPQQQPWQPGSGKSKEVASRKKHNRERYEPSGHVDPKPTYSSDNATRQHSDLEEGETVSSDGRSSRRSSGSPYNPPVSVSADPGMIQRALESQECSSDKIKPAPQPVKSTAQLCIQAKGALLSLAPHNIRFKQLVAEGIHPDILKRLYDAVGISVSDSDYASSIGQALPMTSETATATASTKDKPSAAKPNVPIPRTPSSTASQSQPGKPLERKELIARMLAEKAAKATSKEASPTANTNSAPTASDASHPNPREKNKAQTDLARQRIEELKRKALLNNQQKLQETRPSVPHDAPAPAIHHPLPVRPPLPENQPPAGLPGLSMTGSEQQSDVLPGETPVPRAIHRKRPLASDFDEPVPNSKKHLNAAAEAFNPADQLIITISEDESLYGDDEDDKMELDSDSEDGPAPIINSFNAKSPPTQASLLVTRASTSTPQAPSSSNDQGDIQSKDLEIQLMRRKIAELELRRRSKLAASGTQSPRTFDDSGASSSSAQVSAADAGVNDAGVSSAVQTLAVPAAISPAPTTTSTQTSEEPGQQTASASTSSESDSDESAMEESDDSSSDDSHASKSGDGPIGSPAQIGDMTGFSDRMDIDSKQSVSGDSADVDGSRRDEIFQRDASIESETYEPPEPDTEARSECSSYSPPPFSPNPEPVDSTADLVPSSDATQPSAELTNAPQVSGSSVPQVSDQSSQVGLEIGALGTGTSATKSAHKFTPYTSPLRSFKAYRYHPDYVEDVPNGYRSLTYSHNIDSMKPFCPYEVSGGVCNDRSCEYQHFRDMSLSDDKILIEMGSAREGQTEEEKETYLDGLKAIINDLRRDKVKDFNTVASEIAAYRRRFLQDPSRVLTL